MDEYKANIGVCAGSYMLKWNLLDQHIHQHPMHINQLDEVNVFINLECVIKNLSMQRGLSTFVTFNKQKFVIELESSILNLIANYRMYFQKEKCFPKLYFYITSLNDNNQQMKCYNKYYRDFYHNKYTNNPQFKLIGETLKNIVLPEIKLILLYVPGCYYLESDNFDSSLIPQIVSSFSNRKNVIITGDIFDTLYMFNPNFLPVYINRRFLHFSVYSDIESVVRSIIKDESPFDLTIFNSELYYKLLLSVRGSKIRNIKASKGFGYLKFMEIIKQGIKDDIILKDFESINSIIQLFPENYREDIKIAFQCMNLDTQYQLLSDINIENIKSQIIDKIDIKSVEALNNKRFIEFPINIQGLIN